LDIEHVNKLDNTWHV